MLYAAALLAATRPGRCSFGLDRNCRSGRGREGASKSKPGGSRPAMTEEGGEQTKPHAVSRRRHSLRSAHGRGIPHRPPVPITSKNWVISARSVSALRPSSVAPLSTLPLATGALGKPVWLLNRYATDWRWLLDCEDSPWYPTLRQFRHEQAGRWEAPLAKLRDALLRVIAGDRAGLRSSASVAIGCPV